MNRDHSSAISDARVTLLIPTFRRLDMLERCLVAAEASRRAFDEIVVVARSRDDAETWAWLSKQCAMNTRLIAVDVDIPGQVQAMNAGLASATGDFIAIIDDDALVHDDWLERLLTHLIDPSVGGAGGRDRVHMGGEVLQGHATIAGVRNGFGILTGNHHIVTGPARSVDSLKGCNWILRRTALGSLRFDDRLLGKGAQVRNETWMCYNILNGGWKLVLDPQAQVDHYPAPRPDGARESYTRARCHDQTANTVAGDLAFASGWQKLKYLGYSLAIGTRSCPGAYFVAHALARRPADLPTMLTGGWRGFLRGWGMARRFGANPPGEVGKFAGPTPS